MDVLFIGGYHLPKNTWKSAVFCGIPRIPFEAQRGTRRRDDTKHLSGWVNAGENQSPERDLKVSKCWKVDEASTRRLDATSAPLSRCFRTLLILRDLFRISIGLGEVCVLSVAD